MTKRALSFGNPTLKPKAYTNPIDYMYVQLYIMNNGRFNSLKIQKMAIEKTNSELNEDFPAYQKKQIRSFTSFEQMNEEDAKEMAIIPPLTHLQNATLLAKKIFSADLEKPMDMKIKFK